MFLAPFRSPQPTYRSQLDVMTMAWRFVGGLGTGESSVATPRLVVAFMVRPLLLSEACCPRCLHDPGQFSRPGLFR